MNEDLGAILRTIREVETNLERRHARAEGTLLMIWGLVGAVIFAFYQLVELDHEAYHRAFGPLVSWMWVLPMALGYAASAVVGARLGRLGADEERKRRFRNGLVPGLIVAALVTVLVVTERYSFVYGGVTLVSGLAPAFFWWRAPPSAVRTASLVVGGAMALVGVVLLLFGDALYASGVAALTFLVGYLLLGTVRYRLGR